MQSHHYYDLSYDNKERFCSYWHQINEIMSIKAENVLEIGIGNGMVSKYLKERGRKITTLDIHRELKPEVVGSILRIPFTDASFDVVACYEVLEHISYKDFLKALAEIHRVSSLHAILSLPDRTGRAYKFHIQIPKIGDIKKLITIPRLKPLKPEFDGVHYWEIGTHEYSLKKIMTALKKAGFVIKRNYRVFEYPYHRFFLLMKH
ncbi:MAG: methyltransferase domain-containing protein [Desulfobacterales bacterium]|jgi:ubiquinone/menaquinone biosynthesis C-methylase UbiE